MKAERSWQSEGRRERFRALLKEPFYVVWRAFCLLGRSSACPAFLFHVRSHVTLGRKGRTTSGADVFCSQALLMKWEDNINCYNKQSDILVIITSEMQIQVITEKDKHIEMIRKHMWLKVRGVIDVTSESVLRYANC